MPGTVPRTHHRERYRSFSNAFRSKFDANALCEVDEDQSFKRTPVCPGCLQRPYLFMGHFLGKSFSLGMVCFGGKE